MGERAHRYCLRGTPSFHLEGNGNFRVWIPSRRGYIELEPEQVAFLAYIAPGCTPAEAAERAGVEFSSAVDQLFDQFLDYQLIRPVGEAPAREQPQAPMGENTLPIFIVGCPRSGTTLVRWLVDAHPRINCPPESRILEALRDFHSDERVMRSLPSLGLPPNRLRAAARGMIESVYADVIGRSGKARWADKTVFNAKIVDYLRTVFDGQCQFVIVMRHALDVALSLSQPNFWGPPNDEWLAHARPVGERFDLLYAPLEAGARLWADYADHLRRFRTRHPDLCHVVRYEELVVRPEPVARELFTFLGERFESSLIEEMFRAEHRSYAGDPSIRRTDKFEPDRRERWRALPAQAIASVADLVNPGLEQWGYEPV